MSAPRIAIAYDCLFPYTTGGGERLYRSYAEHLDDLGWDVDYLTAVQWEGAPPAEDAFTVTPVVGRLRLYDGRGVRRNAAALSFAFGLFRHLLRHRRSYDAVIVGALPILNVFAARIALAGSRTRLVADYLEVWGRAQWVEYAGGLWGNVAWALQRAAVRITPIATCHSQLTARQLRREGLRSRLLVSPGLIDGASDVTPRPADDPAYVIYAGRHIADKRVETIPAAVAQARRELPGLELVILGSGPTSDDIRAAVADADGAAWVRMPGFVSEEELSRLVGGAAALVNPSRREGYGLVVVEASAHGTPVILVDDDGNAATELVEPGRNGFVARSAAPADLAHEIVAAVRAGQPLRASARSWYEEALRTRTVRRTTENIARALDANAPTTKDAPR
ncbi:glycosyltransferase family 4 protein [Microbacterium sp. cx-59]|uniref:glycosyltransferase family 4 protein n=1 Tax=Microbacterium sp. cx-59 TaxID=2891207 RepID=UPI001E458050|nr:glycosyltransferase [Microbacterium sp. cx-59]MCC4907841.1 glycosyltransferase [Microbacterium sp. cx-59]